MQVVLLRDHAGKHFNPWLKISAYKDVHVLGPDIALSGYSQYQIDTISSFISCIIN